MESNQNGEQRKPKRPRIGAIPNPGNDPESRFEKVNYGSDYNSTPRPEGEGNGEQQYSRPYQPRPRYNQQQQGEGGYQQRPYQPRPRYNQQQQGEGGYQQQRPYQPRPRYNQQQQGEGGYQQQRPYQPRPRYNQQQQGEGGYQQQRPYQPRPRYNQQQGEGGYQQRPRYNQQQQQRPRYNQQGGRPGQKPFQRPGKSFTPRPKQIDYELPEVDPNEEVRLNKFMANAGICSRREADEFIKDGKVKVNGQVVTELGTKITAKDVVEYDDQVVVAERKCYVLLNKPKDCVTTSDDPNGRTTVLDLVKNACKERIYPVGRLDRNTTGVLLLTNDGDLASKLTHPQYVKKKIYHVWTDRDISEDDMQRIADGIELEDGPIHADAISYATETDRNQAGIEIHSGRNRIVRRIFESLGYHVTKLDRVYFAGLTKKNLPRGRWRYLTQEEVNFLKMGSFE
ncbi:MAG: rRNA pseudouridine synthase [Bacteroides sp.]|nr:rRNA pseudouridine synthase [Bacteroides sp.]